MSLKLVVNKGVLALCAVVIFGTCILHSGCKNTHDYTKTISELDSLAIVLQQRLEPFQKTDSIKYMRSYSQHVTYSQFIELNLKDTVTKEDAEHLQHFASTQQGFQDYFRHYTTWTKDAHIILSQLRKLSTDLKNGSISHEEAIKYASQEKLAAQHSIEELSTTTTNMRLVIETHTKHLPYVELLIKRINNNELPQLVQPNSTAN